MKGQAAVSLLKKAAEDRGENIGGDAAYGGNTKNLVLFTVRNCPRLLPNGKQMLCHRQKGSALQGGLHQPGALLPFQEAKAQFLLQRADAPAEGGLCAAWEKLPVRVTARKACSSSCVMIVPLIFTVIFVARLSAYGQMWSIYG